MLSQLSPVYPTTQDTSSNDYIYFLFSYFNLFTISFIIPAYAFLTIIVPLVPKQHIIVPPSILQQCYVEFIYCQWLFCFTLIFKTHLTYLPAIFLDEDGIMLTNTVTGQEQCLNQLWISFHLALFYSINEFIKSLYKTFIILMCIF